MTSKTHEMKTTQQECKLSIINKFRVTTIIRTLGHNSKYTASKCLHSHRRRTNSKRHQHHSNRHSRNSRHSHRPNRKTTTST